MFFLLGLFDGRPADYLFMILFNGCILIVSFYDAKHALHFNQWSWKWCFSMNGSSVSLFVVFLLQTKCIVLKVKCCWLLLPKWSMLRIFLNHHHHHHPYMKRNFIFSVNNKQECRYKLIHVEHHEDHCFSWLAMPSDNRLPHTFDGKFYSSIQLLQVG